MQDVGSGPGLEFLTWAALLLQGEYLWLQYKTSIWPRPINQGQDFIDWGIVQIAELFTLRCDQTLSVSGSPKSYYNIRWITAVQGHVRNFFIFWLGSFLCG